MKTRILACVAILLAAAPAVASQKRFILRGSAAKIAGYAARNGLVLLHQYDAGGQVLALLSAPGGESDKLASVDAADGLSVETDRRLKIPEPQGISVNQSTVAILDALSSRDLTGYYGNQVWTSFLNQPASRIIRTAEAQAMATGAGVVAVIDTGVDPNHPALQGSLTPGYDFTRNQAGTASELADLQQSTVAILDGSVVSLLNKNPAQVNQSTVAILDQSTVAILDRAKLPASFGHGTMVASLVHLVAPTATIMPLKAFNSDGTGTLYDVLRAVYFAVNSGARVINMSFSMEDPSDELLAAISYANSRRVICVASAGNSGKRSLVYPAAWKKVSGIGSTNNADTRSTFSNYGDQLITLAAPGEGLIAAWPFNNYAAASGTSFSTALVSGAAALLVQIDGNTNQPQAEAALSRADPAGARIGRRPPGPFHRLHLGPQALAA